MKKLIRHSVFETNSSSSHSVSIPTTMELLDSIHPDEEGRIILYGGEFGWGHEEFTDALTKANYLAVWAKDYSGHRRDECLAMLEGILRMQTGAKEVVYNFTTEYGNDEVRSWAYIDHQSETVGGEVFTTPSNVMNFIFNPNSILVISNDNM
jgi:hypothetical protein